jgi:hypothetical protein
MARSVRLNVGRQQFRGSQAGGSEQALRQQFDASLKDVLGNMQAVIDGVEGALPEIVVEVLRPTFEKSQTLVPVASGTLKNSGYIEARQYSHHTEAEIGYARGGDPDYAIYVHEMPHWHNPPTQAKFLQQPVEEDYPSFPNRLAEAVRGVVGA